MENKTILILSIVGTIVVTVWKLVNEIVKNKVKKTETKIDDIIVEIINLLIPIIQQKIPDITNSELEKITKETAKNKMYKIGININDDKLTRMVKESMNKDMKKSYKIEF